MYASQNGHTATAQLLVEAGADKDAKNEVGQYERIHGPTGTWTRGGSVAIGLWT